MAFANQFALTLELSRLIPIKWATNKATEFLMNRARDLHHSGSDIVVEEDLVNVLGRNRISAPLTSSFKNVVAKSSSNHSLWESITLQAGAGPTTIRAFQESPYFAMVIQLSLLAWTFEINFLATALADALRKRLEGATSSSTLQAAPSRSGILGVLRAIESQTSAFNWNMMLHAVSSCLGYEPHKAPIDFPQFVLQGLLDMFPMAQTLPNDRFIHIQIPVGDKLESGVCTLVVWAHHVLDLTVLVRRGRKGGKFTTSVRFGQSGPEHVVIEEVAPEDDACIILLDSDKEHLLMIKSDPDADQNLIGSVNRIFAKGWGILVLEDSLPENLRISQTNTKAIVEELAVVTSAFAFIIAKNLIKDDYQSHVDSVGLTAGRTPIVYKVDERCLLQASHFLFDNPRIRQGEINSYVAQYSSRSLDGNLPLPTALDVASRTFLPEKNRESVIQDEWETICTYVRNLGIFLVALAHVLNIAECEDLMFSGVAFSDMCDHGLAQQLEEWNGIDSLRVTDDAWLQAIAVPLMAHRTRVWKQPWEKVCLFSERGWSAWISTFGNTDPAYATAGSIRVGRGTPCRNGVWKSCIWDSPQESWAFIAIPGPDRVESCEQTASLRCAEAVTLENPYCGEGEEVFIVCARFRLYRGVSGQPTMVRIGYKELQRSLWGARASKRCSHGSRSRDEVTLSMGCATISGFGRYLYETDERILITLTAGSIGARWLALTTLPSCSIMDEEEEEDEGTRQILLRGNDCCLQCAIDQAAAQPGKWIIIL
ncbi:hypothetical protein MMC22_002165 [Lobaria immixta]|nr:hypothetical protein [Lobaria immixta]